MEGNYIIKLNYKCNANCIFCADSPEERGKKDPDFDELIKELKENRKRFDSIIISGGEPTIHGKIFDYLDQVKQNGYKQIAMSTNGLLFYYPNFTKMVIEKGVKLFIISFQTIDEKDYYVITGIKKAHEYVIKGMENIKKYNGILAANTVIHKLNYKKLPEIVKYLIDFKLSYIQLAFMNPVGTSVRNGKSTMVVSFTEALPYVKECFKVAEENGFEKLFVENVPICAIKEYKDKISDLKKPEANREYYNAGKTKPEKCKRCMCFDICDGVWSDYLKQFGDNELNPITILNSNKGYKNGLEMQQMWKY